MFKRKKTNLTLRQVHELYLLLKDSLPEKEEKYLIDELDKMLEKITEETMVKVLEFLNVDTEDKNGIQVLILLVRRLKEVDFFEYVRFLRGFNA